MPTEWTIETLKELFEEKFKARDDLHERDAAALELQAKEYERRLHDLNNEAQRLQTAVTQNVSADTWNAFIQTDKAWKENASRVLQDALPRSEFQTFKESTGTAGDTRKGFTAGVSTSASTVQAVLITVGGIALVVLGVLNYLKP